MTPSDPKTAITSSKPTQHATQHATQDATQDATQNAARGPLQSSLHLHQETLPSGLRVVVSEAHSAPVVSIQIWVDVGSADEAREEGGVAHVHEHMLFKGTKKRAVGEIAAEVEAAGGEINAWTSYDQTVYHVVMASRFFDTGLDVLSDAVINSAFDADELARELKVILEEIKRAQDQPSTRVSRALFDLAFTVHPYKHPVIGLAEVVENFDRDRVLQFFNAHYRAERLTVLVVGDIDSKEAVAKIAEAFKDVPQGGETRATRPVEPPQTQMRVCGLTDQIEESQVAIGFAGPGIDSPDLAAADVLSVLLGQGDSSRLSDVVQRQKRLVNEIYAYAYTPKDAGLLVVGATLRHEKIGPALSAIGAQLARLRTTAPSVDELRKAKTMLQSESIYQRESVEGLSRRLGFWATMTGKPDYEEAYQAAVGAVTVEDVLAVAQKRLQPQNASVVAMVPAEQSALVKEDALRKLVQETLLSAQADDESSSTSLQPLPPPCAVTPGATSQNRTLVQLDSGARLIVEQDPRNPIVAVRAAWLGGLRLEDPAHAGLFHMLGEMVVRGTDQHSCAELNHRIDAMAGTLDAFSGRNSVGMRGTFLRKSAADGISLLGECLQSPAFSQDELSRVRELVLEDIGARIDNPSGLCFDLFNKLLWQEHPYRRDVIGTADGVESLNPELLAQSWKNYTPANQAVMSIVGDVDVDTAVDFAQTILGKGGSEQQDAVPSPVEEAAISQPRVGRLIRDRAQAHILLGHRGLSLDDENRFALEVMCSVLSGQGGRLFLELRDRQSLCYSVSAFSVEGLEPGSFAVYMGTSPEKVDQALAGISDFLDDLTQEGVTSDELGRAKRYLSGTHDIGLQRLGARGNVMAFNELYGLGYQNHLKYVERIEAVTVDQVRSVAQRILTPASRVTAIVGPESTGGPEANLVPAGLPKL